MSDQATVSRYPLGVVVCHWLVVFLISGMIVTGLQMEDMPRGPEKLALIDLHGSMGTSLILIMLCRLWFRLKGPLPSDPDSGSAITNKLAHSVHWVFYALIFGQIVGGIITVWTVLRPIWFFGVVEVASPWAERDMDLHHSFEDMHKTGFLVLASLIGLHLVAVVYHTLSSRDGYFGRILPFKN